MNMLESLRVSWGALTSNRLRSILTMLGVIIGVATVVALVSLGQAAQETIEATVNTVGSNLIRVDTMFGYARLTPEDCDMIVERVPTVTHGSPWVYEYASAKGPRGNKNTLLLGTSHEVPLITTYVLERGRFFDQRETLARHNVAVLGHTVYTDLFGNRQAIGETIALKGQEFTVIGILEKKGTVMGQDADDLILIPYTTAMRMKGTRYTPALVFKARSAEVATVATGHITRILEERFRNLQRPDGDVLRTRPFTVQSQDDMLKIAGAVTGTFTVLLGGIAAVSLLVGGIGIMNIMLVSVTERTREIGIRKAIGARKSDILTQFLVESVILSGTGGMVGLMIGALMARGIGLIGNMNVFVSLSSIIMSFGFACAVGVFFGVYPAVKASTLDPIVALRYE